MSEALANFIRQRLSELDAHEAELQAGLAAVAEERASLNRAAAAANIATQPVQLPSWLTTPAPPPGRRRAMSERSMKDAVVAVLREAGQPLTALDILPTVNAKLGTDYPRTSLSPQLSRLKSEGRIIKAEGNFWRLPDDAAETNEAADQKSAAPISQQVSPLAAGSHPSDPVKGQERQVVDGDSLVP
jgi:hypothetical protein